MLVEMMSPAFKEKDEVRPPIRFKEGLNVVLRKEDGTNSIETRKIVTDNKVLKLSDNHCELYGESWNVEEAQSENKL